MIMCHLCNLYTSVIREFVGCSHIIFPCSCLFVFAFSLCLCSQNYCVHLTRSWCAPHILRGSVVWHDCWLRYCREKGCICLLWLSPIDPPSPSPLLPLHPCLKIALELHMRYLFGLKLNKLCTTISKTWQRAEFPCRHFFFFFFKSSRHTMYLPPMNVGAVLEL